MKNILELKNVSTTFDSRDGLVKAVCGVNLEIAPGEIVGLVGETGCGKSDAWPDNFEANAAERQNGRQYCLRGQRSDNNGREGAHGNSGQEDRVHQSESRGITGPGDESGRPDCGVDPAL